MVYILLFLQQQTSSTTIQLKTAKKKDNHTVIDFQASNPNKFYSTHRYSSRGAKRQPAQKDNQETR
jgi:hypothetical protein